eukprot:Transcript_5420.p3 GENE.Transcript_5420~~Transcript_5420.p3  ORF type:complete len:149 (+),score=68.45 Transcript_5420:98-544(+)
MPSSCVTRQVGTEEARVSRLLLCARCEYFRTFLSADFADARAVARSGVLDLSHTLPGLSRPSLLALLRFVYAGHVRHPAGGAADVERVEPQCALELLRPATALLLDELKGLCEAVLVNYLDRENCEALAQVAEGCFATRLLSACEAMR